MSVERDEFGPKLRAQREGRGIALSSIAASTKVALPLLEGLERNDFSRWPEGAIYRRAFLRAYVVALRIPPDPVLAEFARLFPDEGTSTVEPAGSSVSSTASTSTAGVDNPTISSTSLALTFADARRRSLSPAARRILRSAVEALAIVAAGLFCRWAFASSILGSAGLVALVYYPLTNAMPRGTLARAWARVRGRTGSRSSDPTPVQTAAVRSVTSRLGHLPALRPALTVIGHASSELWRAVQTAAAAVTRYVLGVIAAARKPAVKNTDATTANATRPPRHAPARSVAANRRTVGEDDLPAPLRTPNLARPARGQELPDVVDGWVPLATDIAGKGSGLSDPR